MQTENKSNSRHGNGQFRRSDIFFMNKIKVYFALLISAQVSPVVVATSHVTEKLERRRHRAGLKWANKSLGTNLLSVRHSTKTVQRPSDTTLATQGEIKSTTFWTQWFSSCVNCEKSRTVLRYTVTRVQWSLPLTNVSIPTLCIYAFTKVKKHITWAWKLFWQNR